MSRLVQSVAYLVGFTGLGYVLLQTFTPIDHTKPVQFSNAKSDDMRKLFSRKQ